MTKDTVGTAATVVVALCALAVTVVFVRDRFAGGRAGTSVANEATTRTIDDWRAVASIGQRLGRPNAPVTVTEFSDFQCPYCAVAKDLLRNMQARYGGQVSLVYRHFPLDQIHPMARGAAIAAECAAAEGRFFSMHDQLFAQQGQIGIKPWLEFAREAGVTNLPEFRRCIESGAPAARITEDLAAGRSLGIPGTPTLLVNDQLVLGGVDSARLDILVREALDRH